MPEDFFIENPVGMSEVLYSPRGPVALHVIRLSRLVQAAAKEQVGVSEIDHRHLRDNIKVNFSIGPEGPIGTVTAEAPYAEFHHEPQDAYDITTTDHPMVFQVDGVTVFTYHVHHPAWPGNPFLRQPMDAIVGGAIVGGLAARLQPGLPL